ncbi:LIC12162 family protein [Alphaproteobacteria bacterium]|nr:LIC12162 family protein [Alphaproteobacteria bacterium]
MSITSIDLQLTEFFEEASEDAVYLSEFSAPSLFISQEKGYEVETKILFAASALDLDRRRELHQQSIDFTKSVFLAKVEYLNQVTEKDFSEKFWWILVSPWLYQFVNQLLTYSLVIERALETLPEGKKLKCQLISPSSWLQHYDTLQALNAWKKNRQNHEILSFLLWIKKTNQLQFTIKELPSEKCIANEKFKKIILENIYLRCIFPTMTLMNKVFARKAFAFGTPSECLLTDIALFIKSFFSIIPIYSVHGKKKCPRSVSVSTVPKKGAVKHLHSEFQVVAELAFDLFIPFIYTTGFREYFQGVSKVGGSLNYRAFGSSTDWYFNEFFKFTAASKVDVGAKLIGIQHGGNYGVEKYHPLLEYETTARNLYLTWGWKDTYFQTRTEIKPGPALKLLPSRHTRRNRISNYGILFGASETPLFPRYIARDDHSGALSRLKSQMEFFDEVGYEIRSKTKFRLNTNNLGWDQVARIHKQYPEIRSESFSQAFRKSLALTEIYVTNILSTTYVEALVLGCPTILILNKELDIFSEEAQVYMDRLEEVGVVHYSGKSAGSFLKSVEGDISAWWGHDLTQLAVAEYTEKFIYKRTNAIDFWVNFCRSTI